MDPTDEAAMLKHMVDEFRQALADAQYALATANARLALQAQLIASLHPAAD